MTEYRLVYSRKAANDLETIERYIAEQASASIAQNYIERLERRCQRLILAPWQGTRRDYVRPGLRTTGFERRITIVFRVTGTTVRILGFAYGGKRFETSL